ncbi:hypothetical protein L1987_35977 [Smallanthus sonchifolius]|uniref:Uncharacterized protein n=1 Tax=Smallanthus sonchifolius TaxID=185202 RepID=A0ACB9HDK7_9ASTR|nr:hypothetical protein L1987_35977 [Smallanthus sonchifolius]
MMLSKSWVSSWTSIRVLNFNSYGFDSLYGFDKFVHDVLSLRRPAKLEKLTFKRSGTCKDKILRIVFDYAFSHGVTELEVDIRQGEKAGEWPISWHVCTDSLTRLKLESSVRDIDMVLGGLFKNVTNLHLKRLIIKDLDPFSMFPALEKLTLLDCPLNTNIGNVLNVNALLLSELIISSNNHQRVNLTTPKLRYFEYHRGVNFPHLTTHDLPILDTAVIDYNVFSRDNQDRMMFDDVLRLFNTLIYAKPFKVFSSVVYILSLFPNELVNHRTPFRDLKCLKLDFSQYFCEQASPCKMWSESINLVEGVKAYLWHDSYEAKLNITGVSWLSSSGKVTTRRRCVQASTKRVEVTYNSIQARVNVSPQVAVDAHVYPESCTMLRCTSPLVTVGLLAGILRVEASEEFIILSNNHQRVNLTTPKLGYFKFREIIFPQLTTHDLPILDTVVIDYDGFSCYNQDKIMFDDVLRLFNTLCNAKLLTVSSSVHILSLLPGESTYTFSGFEAGF